MVLQLSIFTPPPSRFGGRAGGGSLPLPFIYVIGGESHDPSLWLGEAYKQHHLTSRRDHMLTSVLPLIGLVANDGRSHVHVGLGGCYKFLVWHPYLIFSI